MNIVRSLIVSAVFATASAAPVAVSAQAEMDHSKMGSTKVDASKEMADGEIRKIDKAAGKLTIRHGDIKSLDMPPMTMVFQVKDKAMLDKVQSGDKVKFNVVLEAGKMTVTEIQPAK